MVKEYLLHLRVYLPICVDTTHQNGSSARMSIYLGYESPTIVHHIEPLTGDLFTARFADCHFDKNK